MLSVSTDHRRCYLNGPDFDKQDSARDGRVKEDGKGLALPRGGFSNCGLSTVPGMHSIQVDV